MINKTFAASNEKTFSVSINEIMVHSKFFSNKQVIITNNCTYIISCPVSKATEAINFEKTVRLRGKLFSNLYLPKRDLLRGAEGAKVQADQWENR